MEDFFIGLYAIGLLIYPLITLITAGISSFKSKHIWCVSMYMYVLILTFMVWDMLSILDGYPLVLYRWWELVIIYAITIAVPLFIQLKQLNRKTYLTLLWVASVVIPFIVYSVVYVGLNYIETSNYHDFCP